MFQTLRLGDKLKKRTEMYDIWSNVNVYTQKCKFDALV